MSFNDQPLATAWEEALVECKVELELRCPGRCTLRFADPGYALVEDGTVGFGTLVTVSVPGGGRLIRGEVTSVSIDQREGEQPELLIVAMDKSHRMGRSSNVATYTNATYSDIVRKVGANYGLEVRADTTPIVFDYVLQVSSDLTFLGELASRCGFDWWVDGDTLHFSKPTMDAAAVKLRLGGPLRSFSAQASDYQPNRVEIYGWDRLKQEQLVGTSDRASFVPESGLLDKAKKDKAFGTATMVSAAVSGSTQEEVKELSQALLDWATWSSLRAVGVADVAPEVHLATVVEVEDAGPLSGKYPVTRIEHSYRAGTGFVTRFWSGPRAPFPAGAQAGGYGPVTGPSTHHSGVVVGDVTNVNDPEKSGRVKVRFPGLNEQEESAWSRLVSFGGGKERGNVSVPEVGDEVLVAFENGDPRQPVVLGGLYGNKSTMPNAEQTIQDGQVMSRRFTSRLGHFWEFSDGTSPDKQYFMVQLAGQGHTLKITKQDTTLQIPSGQPLTIKAGNTEVAFSSSGDVSIKGPNITIQAEQAVKISGLQVNVSADSELQMQGQSQASLKGAMLQLQGEATASLKGGIVQIN